MMLVTEFDPVGMLRCLERNRVSYLVIGGIAARLRGAPLLTQDVDITPAQSTANLKRLSTALKELNALLRSPSDPEGVPFPIDADFLSGSETLTLTTDFGELDLVATPDGTGGYKDLARDAEAIRVAVDPDLFVAVASLADIIRSKEAAGRDKDRAALPLLRTALEESTDRDGGN